MRRTINAAIRVIQVALIVALSLLLASNVYLLVASAINENETPTVFGYSMGIIMSGSMEPELRVDDLVVSRATEGYGVGDVITFRSGRTLTTHRIVGEDGEGFITRGDANNTEDRERVRLDAIVGEVVCVLPGVGRFISMLRTPLGMTLLVLVGLFMLELPYIVGKFTVPRTESELRRIDRIRRRRHR